MKKIVIYTLFLAFAIFSCNKQGSIREYIEKGFAKPSIQGYASFNPSSEEGYNKKLYVPSDEDIEVEFKINNKYSQELTCSVDIPQNKKALFNKEPKLKEFSSTKIVILFNFKEEADASIGNNFLGESVDVKIGIYEKKNRKTVF